MAHSRVAGGRGITAGQGQALLDGARTKGWGGRRGRAHVTRPTAHTAISAHVYFDK